MRRSVWAARTAIVLSLLARPASAQRSPTDVALATELFNAGRDLMKSGDALAACPKLAESARLDPKVGTFARLAECEEAIGRLAPARAHWQQTISLARAASDARVTHAEEELARIDRIVPKIEIVTTGAAPPGLVIAIDQVELGVASLGARLPVDPGTHALSASATGKKTWTMRLEAKADGVVTRITIPVLDDAIADAAPLQAPPPQAAPLQAAPGHAFPWRTVGLVAAGAGVVGLGLGTVFGLDAKSKRDDSNAPGGCRGNDCPPAAAAIRNDARAAGDVATVLFVVGGVLTAAGVTTWLLAPTVTTNTAGLSMRGAW